jgi:hypothetical protein
LSFQKSAAKNREITWVYEKERERKTERDRERGSSLAGRGREKFPFV